jgi:hypothetical protein
MACTRSKRALDQDEESRWQKWKCCTFQPFVANYLIGAMLETKPIPPTDQAVLSPIGLCPSAEYRSRFFAKADEKRGEELICSFFDRERHVCTQWQNRPSECATYFCQESAFFHARSQDLFDWEMAVAQMALVEHGFEPKEIEDIVLSMDSGDEKNGQRNWRDRLGNEMEFYRSCWQWARERTGSEILSWLPKEAQARFDSWVRFA